MNTEVFGSELDISDTDMDVDTESDDGADLREALPEVDHKCDSDYLEQDVGSNPSQSFQVKASQRERPAPTAAASDRRTDSVRAAPSSQNSEDKSPDNPPEAGRTEDTGVSSPTNTKSKGSGIQERPITNSTQHRIQPEMPKAGSNGAEAVSVTTLPGDNHQNNSAMPEDISQSQQLQRRVEEAATQNESLSTPREVAQPSASANNQQFALLTHEAMKPSAEVTTPGSQQQQSKQPLDRPTSDSLHPDQNQNSQQTSSNHGSSVNQDAPKKTFCAEADNPGERRLAESDVRQPKNSGQAPDRVLPTVVICGGSVVPDALGSNPEAQSGPRASQNSGRPIPTTNQLASDEVVGHTEVGGRRDSQDSGQVDGRYPNLSASALSSRSDPTLRDAVGPRITGHHSPSKAPNWSPDNRWRAIRHSNPPTETSPAVRSPSVASSSNYRPSVSPSKSRGREERHAFYVSYFKDGGAWKYPAAAVRLTTGEDGRAATDASQPEEYQLVIDPAQVEKVQYNKSRAQDKFEVVLFNRGGTEQRLLFLAGSGGLSRQGIKLFRWIVDVNEDVEVIAGGEIGQMPLWKAEMAGTV